MVVARGPRCLTINCSCHGSAKWPALRAGCKLVARAAELKAVIEPWEDVCIHREPHPYGPSRALRLYVQSPTQRSLKSRRIVSAVRALAGEREVWPATYTPPMDSHLPAL